VNNHISPFLRLHFSSRYFSAFPY